MKKIIPLFFLFILLFGCTKTMLIPTGTINVANDYNGATFNDINQNISTSYTSTLPIAIGDANDISLIGQYVNKIIAGTNITKSCTGPDGDGNCTISSTASGSGDANTFTGVYVGATTGSYDGLLSYSGETGYKAADKLCDADYNGSHICTPDEVLGTIALNDISGFTGQGWIAFGPPGYLANANDYLGFTSNSNIYLGGFWIYDSTTGGQGWLVNCSNSKKISCCMK